jgi:hypothetical protein
MTSSTVEAALWQPAAQTAAAATAARSSTGTRRNADLALSCMLMVAEASMNTTRSLHRAALACAALVLVACGGVTTLPGEDAGVTSGGSSGSGGPYDTCSAPTDCAWGEINHEILSSSDCLCLFGCPSLPLSKTTFDRRNAQYKSLCTPGKDGKGNQCPVDDCAGPPEIACKNGKCVAAQPAP